MTVASETSRVEYTGNGTTTEFPVPFYFLDDGDLVVLRVARSTGATETLTLDSDYTVTGAGSEAGGTVTISPAPSSAYYIVIYRDPDVTQGLELTPGGALPAHAVETAHDRQVMIDQRTRQIAERALRVPEGAVGVSPTSMVLPSVADRASQFLAFDANGLPIAASGTGADAGLREDLASAAAGQGAELVGNALRQTTAAVSVSVGDAGDYTSIGDALAYLSQIRPRYSSEQIRATVTLLSGFEMAEQVLVNGLDLSWITIEAEDAEVTIARSAITAELGPWVAQRPAFGGINGAKLPVIDVLFAIDDSGSDPTFNICGIFVTRGSTAFVLQGAGFKDSSGYGIHAILGSHITAVGAVCTGCRRGMQSSYGSTVIARNSDTSNATQRGYSASNGGYIDAFQGTTEGSVLGFYIASGSAILARLANAAGCNTGVLLNVMSDCDARGIDLSGCGFGVIAQEVSRIDVSNDDARDSDISGCTDDALTAQTTSFINASGGVDVSDCGNRAVRCGSNSSVNVSNADLSGAATSGIRCETGRVVANGANAQKGESPATTDMVVATGGVIVAHGATGGTNIQPNTALDLGIIFRDVGAIRVRGDEDVTLAVGADPKTQVFPTTLTQDRTVTLSTVGAYDGSKFRIVRTAGGAFDLNVGSGPLKAMAAGTWLDVEYRTSWFVSASGSL